MARIIMVVSMQHSDGKNSHFALSSLSRRNVLGGLAALAAGIAGAKASSGTTVPHAGRAVVWGVETEPVTLNPQLSPQTKAALYLRSTYESLLARTSDGSYVPWLALRYEVSDDGLRYLFVLRDDVTFTDGHPLDAAAVVKNFQSLKDPAYAASVSGGAIRKLARAEVVDTYSFALILHHAYYPFLDFSASLPLLSPNAWQSDQLKSGGPQVAGTGPFIMEKYVKGQEISFVRNKNYHWAPSTSAHQGPAWLENIVYRFLPDSTVRSGALLSKQVDIIEGVTGNDAFLFQNVPGFSYQKAFNPGTPYTVFWNTTYGPTMDVRVRKALALGIDLDAVVRSVYRGQRTRAWGILTPADSDLYDPSIEGSFHFDPKQANRYLDEAGWILRDKEGFRTKAGRRLSIELVQSQATLRDQREVLLQAIQAQVRQNIGVDLSINYVDSGNYAQYQKTGLYGGIANSNSLTGGIDVENHYLPIQDGGMINFSRASAPELLDFLQRAWSTLDKTVRFEEYAKLQRFVILEQAYALPLYVPEDEIAAKAAIRGVGFRPYTQLPENAYSIRYDS